MQRDFLRRQGGPQRRRHLVAQTRQIDAVAGQLGAADRQQLHQLAGERLEPPRLLDDDAGVFPSLLLRHIPRDTQNVGKAQNRGERRFHLVRQVRDEQPPLLRHLRQTTNIFLHRRRHRVHIRRERAQLRPAALRCAGGVIPRRDGAGDRAEALQRAQQPPNQHEQQKSAARRTAEAHAAHKTELLGLLLIDRGNVRRGEQRILPSLKQQRRAGEQIMPPVPLHCDLGIRVVRKQGLAIGVLQNRLGVFRRDERFVLGRIHRRAQLRARVRAQPLADQFLHRRRREQHAVLHQPLIHHLIGETERQRLLRGGAARALTREHQLMAAAHQHQRRQIDRRRHEQQRAEKNLLPQLHRVFTPPAGSRTS